MFVCLKYNHRYYYNYRVKGQIYLYKIVKSSADTFIFLKNWFEVQTNHIKLSKIQQRPLIKWFKTIFNILKMIQKCRPHLIQLRVSNLNCGTTKNHTCISWWPSILPFDVTSFNPQTDMVALISISYFNLNIYKLVQDWNTFECYFIIFTIIQIFLLIIVSIQLLVPKL